VLRIATLRSASSVGDPGVIAKLARSAQSAFINRGNTEQTILSGQHFALVWRHHESKFVCSWSSNPPCDRSSGS
jgi:hypothetical protein